MRAAELPLRDAEEAVTRHIAKRGLGPCDPRRHRSWVPNLRDVRRCPQSACPDPAADSVRTVARRPVYALNAGRTLLQPGIRVVSAAEPLKSSAWTFEDTSAMADTRKKRT